MISKSNPNIAPRALDGGLRSGSSSMKRGAEKADFADQLFGAKSGELEGPDRNERKNLGRDKDVKASTSREGQRSDERDLKSESQPDVRARSSAKTNVSSKAKSSSHKQNVATDRNNKPVDVVRNPIDMSQRRPSKLDRATEGPVENVESVEAGEESRQGEVHAQSAMNGATGASAQAGVKLPDFYSREALAKEGGVGVVEGRDNEAKAASEKSIDMLDSIRQDQVHTREEAMEKFLDKMQNELGIPPEKVLQAFSQLDPETLSAPPEETMGEFMSNLELKPGQEGRAQSLYKDMLHKTGEADLNEKLIGLQEGVHFDVLSQHDSSLRSLNHALDQMNSSFFKQDGSLAQPEKAQQAVEAMDAQIAHLMQKQNGLQDDDADQDDDSGKLAMAGLGAAGGAAAMGAKSASSASGATKTLDVSAPSSSSQAVSSLGMHGLGSLPNATSSSGGGLGDDMAGDASAFSGGEPGGLSSHQASKTDASFAQQVAGADAQAAPKPAIPVAAGAGPSAMMMNRQATPEDEQENIRELVKQAQIVLKQGGGEMKLQMKPEGMGQVHLRVSVNDGQVNVQMLTDNEQAKHLLEKGLGDLKESLASHQLRVEHMKVDVGQEIQKQMDQNGNREQARQFAQDFMGQFRDDRQEARDNLFAKNGWRSYGPAQKRGSVQPDAIASSSARGSRSDDGSRRLNLVA